MGNTVAQLSRRVPARTKTVRFTWVYRDWRKMSQQYRDVRAKCHSPIDTCFWCKHKFADGESMNLCGRQKATNVLLCNDCSDQAESGRQEQGCPICSDPLEWKDNWYGQCPRCRRKLPVDGRQEQNDA